MNKKSRSGRTGAVRAYWYAEHGAGIPAAKHSDTSSKEFIGYLANAEAEPVCDSGPLPLK